MKRLLLLTFLLCGTPLFAKSGDACCEAANATNANEPVPMNFPEPAREGEEPRRWLTPEQERALLEATPPAPAPGSEVDREDLRVLLEIQNRRTQADCLDAVYGNRFGSLRDVLGPAFTKKRYPLVFALMHSVGEEAGRVNSAAKTRENRKRPFEAHPEVKNLFSAKNSSYPSGHSCGSMAAAVVLARLFPEKEKELIAFAERIAQSRVVAGVHYPSDCEEGKKEGRAVAEALLANPAFFQAFRAAKAEVEARP